MTAWGALADFFKQYTNFRGTSSRRAFNWVVWFWGSVSVIVASIIVVVARLGAFLADKLQHKRKRVRLKQR